MVCTTKKKDIVRNTLVRYVMEFIISKAIVLFLFDVSFVLIYKNYELFSPQYSSFDYLMTSIVIGVQYANFSFKSLHM